MRVLLTRRPAQAGGLEAGLRAMTGPDGAAFEVSFLPATDTELPDDDGLARLRGAVAALESGGYAVLVVTSPNGARALAAVGWEGVLPSGVRVAATGPGTVRVLREVGLRAEVWVPMADRSAAGILAGLPGPEAAGERLLLPQSARASETLGAGLARRGWEVDRVTAYRTVAYPGEPARRLLPEDPPGVRAVTPAELGDQPAGTALVLTSPSAVEELLGTGAADVLLSGAVPCVALGPPTRRAMEAVGVPVAAQAATPDAAGVAAALRTLGAPGQRPSG
ncbi:uroporphyrinogen-III synthase [Micrococcus sp.]|uniref:uroporphyrinogen-III synthase n=1 Tax=Micrococcus sp. TaxID=1271 RepID=UPI002A90C354|nr:uroporphyrinogen-III synthase [Micrococcus sp.]MDY6054561.1 uroporphyrinogen-III synthase [Micrococcus sp.]